MSRHLETLDALRHQPLQVRLRELEARAVLAQRRERVLVELLEAGALEPLDVAGEARLEARERIVARRARELARKRCEPAFDFEPAVVLASC